MSKENNRRWLDYLLRIMYHNREVYAFVVARIEPDMLLHEEIEASAAQKVLYGCMYNHSIKFDLNNVGAETLATYLKEALSQEEDDPFVQAQIGPLQREVVALYSYIIKPLKGSEGTEKAMEFCRHLYEMTSMKPHLSAVFEQSMLEGSYTDITKAIEETMAVMSDQRAPCDPFDFGQTENAIRISAGEKWLNMLLAGGWRAGNAYGIICPTGEGKTTMATQCSFDIAKEGRPAAVVYTEQTMQEREMVAKCWSLVTGQPSDVYCTQDPDKLAEAVNMATPEERDTMDIVRNNIQIYDFSVKNGSMEELRSIAAGRSGGKKPQALFIDWAGEFAKDLLLTDPRVKGDNETRALNYVADECAKIAREYMIPVIIFHQLGESHVGSPMKQYNHGMAHLCKTFCYNLSYGIVICPRDENDITRIEVSKGRYSGRGYQIVKLDGPRSRFVPMEGYIKGPRRYEDRNRRQKMPDTKKRSRNNDVTDMSGFDA